MTKTLEVDTSGRYPLLVTVTGEQLIVLLEVIQLVLDNQTSTLKIALAFYKRRSYFIPKLVGLIPLLKREIVRVLTESNSVA